MTDRKGKTWCVRWESGELTDPDGQARSPVWGERPDIEIGHELVDQWQEHFGLVERAGHVGRWPYWWTLRFYLLHVGLINILSQLRLLHSIRRETISVPDRIILQHPPEIWFGPLFEAVFPESEVMTNSKRAPQWPGKVQRWANRIRHWPDASRRLRCLPPPNPRKPRILVFSRDRTWTGKRDAELCTAIKAMESAGFDVVVHASSVGTAAKKRLAYRTRPKEHLLDDLVYMRHLLRHGSPQPANVDLPSNGFVFEGYELTALMRQICLRTAARGYLRQVIFSQTLPEIVRHIGPQAAVLTDENTGNQALKTALHLAGIPTIAVQHGVIHGDHLAYIYPKGTAPESVGLCDVTCVYGEYERDLLTNQSIYPDANVVVTGQVQMDRRKAGQRRWGQRSNEAKEFRTATLPAGYDRLLLLCSQDTYRSFMAPRILQALSESNRRNFLVIRPHPRERNIGFWDEAIDAHGVTDRAIVQHTGTLDNWLDACDVHLSTNSTVLAEAAVFGRGNITIGSAHFGDSTGSLQDRVAIELDDYPSLDDAVACWLDATPEKQLEHEANRQRFIERHFHRLDGRTGERIAGVVENVLSQKKKAVP